MLVVKYYEYDRKTDSNIYHVHTVGVEEIYCVDSENLLLVLSNGLDSILIETCHLISITYHKRG